MLAAGCANWGSFNNAQSRGVNDSRAHQNVVTQGMALVKIFLQETYILTLPRPVA
jgi:hypothetical protein